jgi:glycosyltransferase involved in cell wall biosynthesis
LKILILNYEYPPLGGGAGIVSQHLAAEFIGSGHQVTVLTTWFEGEAELYAENNLTVIRLLAKRKHSHQSNPYEMYDWMKKAKKYAREHFHQGLFDVCLANFTLPGGAVAQYMKQLYNLPFVVLSHGHDIPWFSPRQMLVWHLLFNRIIRKVMLDSSYNIVLTDQLKAKADTFIGRRHAEKNKVIPNGVFPLTLRKGFNSSDRIINALFVGRLVDQKDPLTVVRSFQKLQQADIPVYLKIIGDGYLKKEVEDYIYINSLKNIEVLGKISQSRVMDEYATAHLLFAPSREEAMSLAVLEAVSGGIYVIATRISGNKDIILDDVNGNFVSYGDADDIAEKTTKFYEQKFLMNYQYPEFVRNYMQVNYSWKNAAGKYLSLFEKMVRAAKP